MNKSILILLVSIILFSCAIGKSRELPVMETTFTENEGAIPPDFGNPNEILLVVFEDSKGYNKWVEKAFKENYFGKYEFVSKSDLNSSKYSDTEKYRYYFSFDKGKFYSNTFHSTNKVGNTVSHESKTYTGNYKKYLVYDRLKDIKFCNGKEFAYYGHAMEVYAKNLDEKRKNFQINR